LSLKRDCDLIHNIDVDALKIVAQNSGAGVLQSTFDFQPFPDLEQAVKDDVSWLKSNGAVIHDGVEISGWVYEVETGKTKQVV
jgi:carbonic anhydrase